MINKDINSLGILIEYWRETTDGVVGLEAGVVDLEVESIAFRILENVPALVYTKKPAAW
jgi:hypothetical protein